MNVTPTVSSTSVAIGFSSSCEKPGSSRKAKMGLRKTNATIIARMTNTTTMTSRLRSSSKCSRSVISLAAIATAPPNPLVASLSCPRPYPSFLRRQESRPV